MSTGVSWRPRPTWHGIPAGWVPARLEGRGSAGAGPPGPRLLLPSRRGWQRAARGARISPLVTGGGHCSGGQSRSPGSRGRGRAEAPGGPQTSRRLAERRAPAPRAARAAPPTPRLHGRSDIARSRAADSLPDPRPGPRPGPALVPAAGARPLSDPRGGAGGGAGPPQPSPGRGPAPAPAARDPHSQHVPRHRRLPGPRAEGTARAARAPPPPQRPLAPGRTRAAARAPGPHLGLTCRPPPRAHLGRTGAALCPTHTHTHAAATPCSPRPACVPTRLAQVPTTALGRAHSEPASLLAAGQSGRLGEWEGVGLEAPPSLVWIPTPLPHSRPSPSASPAEVPGPLSPPLRPRQVPPAMPPCEATGLARPCCQPTLLPASHTALTGDPHPKGRLPSPETQSCGEGAAPSSLLAPAPALPWSSLLPASSLSPSRLVFSAPPQHPKCSAELGVLQQAAWREGTPGSRRRSEAARGPWQGPRRRGEGSWDLQEGGLSFCKARAEQRYSNHKVLMSLRDVAGTWAQSHGWLMGGQRVGAVLHFGGWCSEP